jgi:hypothetical protein
LFHVEHKGETSYVKWLWFRQHQGFEGPRSS